MSDRPFLPPSRDELQRRSARDFMHAAKWLAFSDTDPSENARRGHATDRVQQITKAAVGLMADTASLTAYSDAQTAWLGSLRQAGVFDRLLPSMVPLPPLGLAHVVTSTYIAGEVLEAALKPVAEFTIDPGAPLPERKVAAITVISRELERFSSVGDLLNRELSAAVIAGVDKVFLDELLASTTPIVGTGSVADIDALLAAVPLGSSSAPYFVLAMDVARTMSTERTSGVRLWPELGVLGGEISGIPTLASDQLAAGTGLLLDAAGIGGHGGRMELASSGQADIFGPGDPLHLWQTNRVGLRAERYFAWLLLRPDAVAAVTGMGAP